MPLNPLPYREVKRRLEAAGFAEHSQKGSHVKFIRTTAEAVVQDAILYYSFSGLLSRHGIMD